MIFDTKYSVYELLATAMTVGVCIWMKQDHENVILLAFHNWTTLYIPLAVIWIYLFLINKGVITKLFNNRLLVYLGNISAYTFLIHYVITQYTSNLLRFLDIDVYGWAKAGIIFVELIFCIISSVIYMKVEGYLKIYMQRNV